MNGKGSKQRPSNHDAFASNYESIFGKKEAEKLFGGKDYDQVWFDELEDEFPNTQPMLNPCLDIVV